MMVNEVSTMHFGVSGLTAHEVMFRSKVPSVLPYLRLFISICLCTHNGSTMPCFRPYIYRIVE